MCRVKLQERAWSRKKSALRQEDSITLILLPSIHRVTQQGQPLTQSPLPLDVNNGVLSHHHTCTKPIWGACSLPVLVLAFNLQRLCAVSLYASRFLQPVQGSRVRWRCRFWSQCCYINGSCLHYPWVSLGKLHNSFVCRAEIINSDFPVSYCVGQINT